MIGKPMRITDVNQQQGEVWRTGVKTRMKVSAANSATQLCMFEQWCDPGHGAPNHLHAVEEVLFVREGQADVWIDDDHVTLTSGQLVIVPAGRKHGFSNTGENVLHIESTLAAPVFEAAYDDKRESPRRWLPAE
jgi:mannose-6-phosphate isomerase-like protein (cupin superfamily)